MRTGWLWPVVVAVFLALASCGGENDRCTDDYDCDGTLVCNTETGKCEPIRCTQDQDCVSPKLRCVDNRCVPRQFKPDAESPTGDAQSG